MRSASLWISLERSNPATFLPQEVSKARRAAATATSMSPGEAKAINVSSMADIVGSTYKIPATTEQIVSSVDGLIALIRPLSNDSYELKGDINELDQFLGVD